MLGKQKRRIFSSQPTPRAAKLLALEPLSLFVEPQEKNILMHHLLHYTDVNPRLMLASYYSWAYYYIVFFLGLGHLCDSYSLTFN